MRIISCHIENFGKLSDFSYTFQEGLNPVCQENGWGKSTLAAFIRVMLFGFRNEGKRDGFENERKRYQPWQKGVYGGELQFETKGTAYSVRRVFGTKASEDEFSLVRSDTLLPSTDFSDKLGEELFQIDANSFLRTVFFSQNDCSCEPTDSINAKLGNLAENTDDMNNFETADKRLNELLNAMTPTRKTGALNKLKHRITELDTQIRSGKDLENTIQEITQKRKSSIEERELLSQQQKELQEQQSRLGAYKDLEAKKSRYRMLQQEQERRQKQLQEAKAYFPGEIPQRQQVEEMLSLCRSAEKLEKAGEIYELTAQEEVQLEQLQEKYTEQGAAPQQLEEKQAVAEAYERLKLQSLQRGLSEEEQNRLEAYREKYGEQVPQEEELGQIRGLWQEAAEKKSLLHAKELSLQSMESMERQNALQAERQRRQQKEKQRLGLTVAAAGLVIALLAVVFVVLEKPALAAAAGCAGLAGILIGLVLARKKENLQDASDGESGAAQLRSEILQDKDDIATIYDTINRFCEAYGLPFQEEDFTGQVITLLNESREYCRLQNREEDRESLALQQRVLALQQELEAFLAQYLTKQERGVSYLADVGVIQTQTDRLRQLQNKRDKFQDNARRKQEIAEQIRDYLSGLQFPPTQNPQNRFMEIQNQLQTIQMREAEAARAAAELQDFETQHSGELEKLFTLEEAAKAMPEENSLEQLALQQEQLTQRRDTLYQVIQSYSEQLESLQESLEELRDKEEELSALKEQETAGRRKYQLLSRTRQLLGEAKSSFTARYTEPLLQGFRHYYDLLAGEEKEKIFMNANTQLRVVEYNLERDVMFQSSGKKDLIGICMRMAFVEAMYQQEKPFLILDDPFVNLDEKRVQGGIRFLEEIAKDYQVLYFTCHESRGAELLAPGKSSGFGEKDRP